MGSIDLSGLTSGYSDYLTSATQSATNSRLNKLTDSDYSNATDDELMDVCKQFESYFLEQIFKEMQKTVPTSDKDKDSSTAGLVDFFKDSAIQELASQSTEQNGLGLAQKLYEQMKVNYNL